MAPVLRCGDVVEGKEGRWEVERKIGEGQFSEVFQVFDRATQEHVSRPLLPPPPLPLSTAAEGGAAAVGLAPCALHGPACSQPCELPVAAAGWWGNLL